MHLYKLSAFSKWYEWQNTWSVYLDGNLFPRKVFPSEVLIEIQAYFVYYSKLRQMKLSFVLYLCSILHFLPAGVLMLPSLVCACSQNDGQQSSTAVLSFSSTAQELLNSWNTKRWIFFLKHFLNLVCFFFLRLQTRRDWLVGNHVPVTITRKNYIFFDWLANGYWGLLDCKINCKDVYRATLNPPCSCFSH